MDSLKVPVSRKPAAMIVSVIVAVIAAVAALALAGCAMGTSTAGVAGFSKGVITAKGSIFVNGIEFDTRSAAITMDDTSSHPDSDLKVGMVVKVKGTIDSASGKGVAQEVVYDANLEGLIDAASINLTAATFSVFGQTISVDATTVFDGVSGLGGLASGDRVEVSGTMDAVSHVLVAARVERKITTGDFELKGIVSGLSGTSFVLTPQGAASGITVNFTGTLTAGISNGSFVEVKFVTYSSPLSTTANRVKLLKDLEASDKDLTEVGGVVSSLSSSGGTVTFIVAGVTVSADSSLASGIANGMDVEVKGIMNAGVLVAQAVKVDLESNVDVIGNVVTAPDVTGGVLTLDGVTIAVDSHTIFRDESAAQLAQFNLSSITIGDHLQVEAVASTAGPAAAVAVRVERLAPSSTVSIAGPVSAAATNSLTLLGVSVNISTATFTDINGAPVATQSAYLALITPGTTVVKVTGTWNGSVFTASSAGIGD